MMKCKSFFFLLLLLFSEALFAAKENQEQGWRWRKQLNFRYGDWGFGQAASVIDIIGPKTNRNATSYTDVDAIHNRMGMQEARITRCLRSIDRRREEGDERNKDRNILIVKFSFLVQSWSDNSNNSPKVVLLGPFPLCVHVQAAPEVATSKELIFRSGYYTGEAVFDDQFSKRNHYEVFPPDSMSFSANDRIHKGSVIGSAISELKGIAKGMAAKGSPGPPIQDAKKTLKEQSDRLWKTIHELEKQKDALASKESYVDELVSQARSRLNLAAAEDLRMPGEDFSQYCKEFGPDGLEKRLLHSEQNMLKLLNTSESGVFKILGRDFAEKSQTKKMAQTFIDSMLAQAGVEKYLFPAAPVQPSPPSKQPAWSTPAQERAHQEQQYGEALKEYRLKLQAYKEKMECLQNSKAFGKIIGIVMHLHSRFDICEDCAIALFLECKMGYYSDMPDYSALKSEWLIGRMKSQVTDWCEGKARETMEAVGTSPLFAEPLYAGKSGPFFVILASSREQLKSSNRRNGYGHDGEFDSIVDIERLAPYSIQKALDPVLVEDEDSETLDRNPNLLRAPWSKE